ncbi:hypothetical protein ACSSS7_002377 [Eimeria intestinalis]
MSASEVQATVKWGTKSFSVQIDPNEPFDVFQAQLYTLTGVPFERQKILCKGKTLKTDDDLRAAVSAGVVKLMLMGTAEDKVESQPPPEKTVFVEDLTPAQQAALLREKKIELLPSGVVNLGNTCYLASVFQMLRPAKEFTLLMKDHVSVAPGTAHLAAEGDRGALRRLCLAIKDFYLECERTTEPVTPYLLQDAEECLSCLMTAVNECLEPGSAEKLKISLPYVPQNAGSSPLDLLFGVQMQVTTKRSSEGEAAPRSGVQIERHRKLTCFLGTPQKPVSTIDESLKFSLGDEVVQVGSSSAGANGAADTLIRTNKISSLALYLIVHFMRFEWKTGGAESEKAKICRSVKFSQTLDMYTYCTKELQDSFKVGRAVVALRREREASSGGAKDTSSGSSAADGTSENTTSAASSSPAASADKEEAKAPASETADILSLAGKPCPTGTYQLLSVVTHQGRYADSGHYVGWARADPPEEPQGPPNPQVQDEEKKEKEAAAPAPTGPAAKRPKNVIMWRKFDDEKVSEVPWETLDLSGGRSDYHVAYLLLMKQTIVVPSEEELRAIQKKVWKNQSSYKGTPENVDAIMRAHFAFSSDAAAECIRLPSCLGDVRLNILAHAFNPWKQLYPDEFLNGSNLPMKGCGGCRRRPPPWGHASRPARPSRWRFAGLGLVVVTLILCPTAEANEGFFKDVFGRVASWLGQGGLTQQQPSHPPGIFPETASPKFEEIASRPDFNGLDKVEDVGDIGLSNEGEDDDASSHGEPRPPEASVWDEGLLKTRPFFGMTRALQAEEQEGEEEDDAVEAAATTRTRPARGSTRPGRETTGSRTRGGTSRTTRSATGSRTTRGGSGGSTTRERSTTRTGTTTRKPTSTGSTTPTTTKSEPVLLYWTEVDEGPLDALKNDEDLTMLAKQLQSSPLAQEDSLITRLAITLFAPTDDALSQLPVKLEELSAMVWKLPCVHARHCSH